jgi:hypothetical protein
MPAPSAPLPPVAAPNRNELPSHDVRKEQSDALTQGDVMRRRSSATQKGIAAKSAQIRPEWNDNGG